MTKEEFLNQVDKLFLQLDDQEQMHFLILLTKDDELGITGYGCMVCLARALNSWIKENHIEHSGGHEKVH